LGVIAQARGVETGNRRPALVRALNCTIFPLGRGGGWSFSAIGAHWCDCAAGAVPSFVALQIATYMSSTLKYILIGIVAGYVLSPMLDRVPVVNKLPKLG
jgi:hypothetical protein